MKKSSMKRSWEIERIVRDDADLHGEIASMQTNMKSIDDRPWMWRLMLGRHVLESGRAEFRDDACTDLMDAWHDWDERLDAA